MLKKIIVKIRECAHKKSNKLKSLVFNQERQMGKVQGNKRTKVKLRAASILVTSTLSVITSEPIVKSSA
jgi:hypothetical protein